MSPGGRQVGGTFQSTRNAAFVSELRERFQGFAVGASCRFIFPLSAVNVAQVCEGARATPAVAGLAEGGEGALVVVSGCLNVSLFPRNVPLLIDGPSSAAMIVQPFKDLGCFTQRRLSARIIASNFCDVRQVVQAPRHRQLIGQHTPALQAAL